MVPGIERPVIDHVLCSRHLLAESVRGWPRVQPDGTTLSDHDGIQVILRRRCEGRAARLPGGTQFVDRKL
jgi:hypothetical protein